MRRKVGHSMWLGARQAAAWRRPSRMAWSLRIVLSRASALAVSICRSMRGRPSGAIMYVTNQTDDEQARLWNGHAGRAWVEAQEVLDQMLRPFEDLLVQAACAAYGGRVLDVGCGTGSTTLAVARRLGAKGRCIGVD